MSKEKVYTSIAIVISVIFVCIIICVFFGYKYFIAMDNQVNMHAATNEYYEKNNTIENQHSEQQEEIKNNVEKIEIEKDGVNISFVLPKKWTIEKRNVQINQMTIEEKKEFLSDVYTGEYTETKFEKMTDEELNQIHIAAVASIVPQNTKVTYTDWNAEQIDFYIIDVKKAKEEILEAQNSDMRISSVYFDEGIEIGRPQIQKQKTNQGSIVSVTYPQDIDQYNKRVSTKIGAGDQEVFYFDEKNDYVVKLHKQSKRDRQFENDFNQMIHTMQINYY